MEEIAKHCFERILAQPKRPLFIAVTGDSGSGKSYLVSLLKKNFKQAKIPCIVINHDEFLIPRDDREPMKSIYYQTGKFAGRSHWEILENMFRLDDFKRVIKELRTGKKSEYYPYSRTTGTISDKPRVVRSQDFIIFDTSMMLDEMDFVILVDVKQENIIKRKLIRDRDIRTPEAIRELHKRVQGFYWENRGKPLTADIIIDNNDFSHARLIKLG